MKKIFLILINIGFLTELSAQQLPVINHYIYNRYLYNPAATGTTGYGNLWVNHRQQWSDVQDAPVNSTLAYDSPITGSNVGVGGMLFTDQTHILQEFGGFGSFAYHLALNKSKSMKLSFGVSAGAINQRINFAEATVENPNDPTILGQNKNKFYFDAAAGVQFQLSGLKLGFSVPQLLGSKVKFLNTQNNDVKMSLTRQYLATASYRATFGKNKTIGLEPVVMARFVDALPFQLEGNLILDWKDAVWLSGGYRLADANAVNVGVGFRIKKRFGLCYTAELGTGSGNASKLGMTHELSVSYRFGNGSDLEKQLKELKERVDKNEKTAAQLRETVREQGNAIDSLQDKDHIQDGRLDNLEKQGGDHERRIKDGENKDNNHDREIRELRELINNGKNTGNGASFRYKKIGSIYFAKGSADLSQEGKGQLAAFKELMDKKGENFAIYLNGNASKEGSSEYNFALSLRRASNVKKYLSSLGVDDQQVIILPQGEESAINDQASETERSQNRRVDIFIAETK